MPIYEWRCDCGYEFQEVISWREADRGRPCPRCTSPAVRVPSTFAIGGSAATPQVKVKKPTIPKAPSYARFCAMDDYAATRMAAYKSGSGAQFDDYHAAVAEKKEPGK
ncbi:MAG: zinc ribbon domain-containing protein [Deltaproteobacteria bacterium]|jgi:putative FmdB family regulatory protein|nr:zinc ribbon domain-containing protein [Deltaproteobacteria bacterium]